MEVKALLFETYLTTIKNSAGTRMFQTIWAEVDGKKQDVVKGGELACATFVSSLLFFFELIKKRHATVKSTLRDLKESGWVEIADLKDGCVIVWEKKQYQDGLHEHLGFYIGSKKAISNDPEARVPVEHHCTYGEEQGAPKRKIIALYWHSRLDEKYL